MRFQHEQNCVEFEIGWLDKVSPNHPPHLFIERIDKNQMSEMRKMAAMEVERWWWSIYTIGHREGIHREGNLRIFIFGE